jgi:hypothetical protein
MAQHVAEEIRLRSEGEPGLDVMTADMLERIAWGASTVGFDRKR